MHTGWLPVKLNKGFVRAKETTLTFGGRHSKFEIFNIERRISNDECRRVATFPLLDFLPGFDLIACLFKQRVVFR